MRPFVFFLLLGLIQGCGGDDGEAATAAPAAGGASATGGASGNGGAGGGGEGGSTGGAAGGGASGAPACVDTGMRPTARAETMGALDGARGRLVFFGGDDGVPKMCNPAPHIVGEMWTYDLACGFFSKVEAASGPGPRTRAAFATDDDGGRLFLFGGRYRAAATGSYTLYDETWSLDLATLAWTQVVTSGTAPSARSSATAVFDPARKELVVFGGNTSASGATFTPQGDVHLLHVADGSWEKLSLAGTPPKARLFHASTIDPASGTVYVYGGGDANAFQGPFFGDLWALDRTAGTWSELSPKTAGGPAARIHSTLVFDGERGRLLLFGGHDDGDVGNDNGTWAFDLTTKGWSVLTPPEVVAEPAAGFCLFPAGFTTPNLDAPDRRSAQLGAFGEGGLWVFGGKTDCGLIDDVWRFDAAMGSWTRKTPATTGEACLRRDHPEQCTSLCL
jgi:hypothetical protein